MKDSHKISDEHISAFIDGELDSDDRIQLLNASEKDSQLQETLCAYNKQKELLLMAYNDVPKPDSKPFSNIKKYHRLGSALAACALLIIGGVAGYSLNDQLRNQNIGQFDVQQGQTTVAKSNNYIIHIANGDIADMRAAMNDVHALLDARDEGQIGQIEVVANEDGLNLLRKGITPYENEIQALIDKDVLFFACTRAIEKLESRGVNVELLPRVHTNYSALDRLVSRLQDDWNYLKI